MDNNNIRIHRGEYSSQFTVLPNALLQNCQLSFRARGLLVHLLSLPPSFHINVQYLIQISQEGRHVIYAIFDELQKAGHLEKVTQRSQGRIAGVVYNVYAEPRLGIATSTSHPNNTENSTAHSHFSPLSKNQQVVNSPDFSPLPKNQHMAELVDLPLSENQEVVRPPLSNFQDVENLHAENLQDINKYNNKINNINKKIAAAETESLAQEDTNKPLLAAAFSSEHKKSLLQADPADLVTTPADLLIAETLTPYQLRLLQKQSDDLSAISGLDPKTLFAGLSFEMLDKSSFVKSHPVFHKKLQAVCKLIRRGTWSLPAGLLLMQKADSAKAEEAFLEKKRYYSAEVSHWTRLLATLPEGASAQKTVFENCLEKAKTALSDFLSQERAFGLA